IVNTTINETIDGRTKLHQTRRKGTNLSIGPTSMSVGVRHHAKFIDNNIVPISNNLSYNAFDNGDSKSYKCEFLSLGNWLGISAAAASTGQGRSTKIFNGLIYGL